MAPTKPDLGSFSMRGAPWYDSVLETGTIDAGKIAESSVTTEKKTEPPPVWPFKGGAKTAAADAADPYVTWAGEDDAAFTTPVRKGLDVKISDSLAQSLMSSASETLTDDDIAVLADPTMGSW